MKKEIIKYTLVKKADNNSMSIAQSRHACIVTSVDFVSDDYEQIATDKINSLPRHMSLFEYVKFCNYLIYVTKVAGIESKWEQILDFPKTADARARILTIYRIIMRHYGKVVPFELALWIEGDNDG